MVKLPAGVDPVAVAPHADAGLTAYHAVKKVKHLALPGSTAVLLGVGGVGHIALQLLRELGSSAVIGVDPNADRRPWQRSSARTRCSPPTAWWTPSAT